MLFFSSLLHEKDKGIVGQLIHRSEQSACMYGWNCNSDSGFSCDST